MQMCRIKEIHYRKKPNCVCYYCGQPKPKDSSDLFQRSIYQKRPYSSQSMSNLGRQQQSLQSQVTYLKESSQINVQNQQTRCFETTNQCDFKRWDLGTSRVQSFKDLHNKSQKGINGDGQVKNPNQGVKPSQMQVSIYSSDFSKNSLRTKSQQKDVLLARQRTNKQAVKFKEVVHVLNDPFDPQNNPTNLINNTHNKSRHFRTEYASAFIPKQQIDDCDGDPDDISLESSVFSSIPLNKLKTNKGILTNPLSKRILSNPISKRALFQNKISPAYQ